MVAKRVDPVKIRAALGLAPDATDDAVRAAMGKVFPAPRRRGPTMTVQEAFDSGRIHAKSRGDWERRFQVDPQGTGEVLASLHPALAEQRERERVAAARAVHQVEAAQYTASAPESDTPLLDALEEHVYGPSREERYRREDLAAEAALRQEIEDEQQQVAASALTDDEIKRLFGE